MGGRSSRACFICIESCILYLFPLLSCIENTLLDVCFLLVVVVYECVFERVLERCTIKKVCVCMDDWEFIFGGNSHV